MTTEYAARKTKEILAKTNGQAKLAEQAMRTLIQRDHAFLLSLVEPYLSGIITHAIERARKPLSGADKAESPPVTKAKPAAARPAASTHRAPQPGNLDSMMKAWAKSFEAGEAPPKAEGKKVSASHIKAMQALIKNPKKF